MPAVPAEKNLPALPKGLKRALKRLYATMDERYLRSDPLEYVRRYKTRSDIEVVGFVASALAYGNVRGIRNSIETVLWRMQPGPHKFIMQTPPAKMLETFGDFKHRFNSGRDVACMLYFLRQAFEKHKSLENLFAAHYNSKDTDIGPALTCFVEEMLSYDHAPFYRGKNLPKGAGVRRFFSSPKDGSACKRLNLFLRWMIRSDKLDLGVWKKIPASKLILPLDTHNMRVSQRLGLTRRKTANWKTAAEITAVFRTIDPRDPVKFDFSLARPGILGMCRREDCAQCLLQNFCKGAKSL